MTSMSTLGSQLFQQKSMILDIDGLDLCVKHCYPENTKSILQRGPSRHSFRWEPLNCNYVTMRSKTAARFASLYFSTQAQGLSSVDVKHPSSLCASLQQPGIPTTWIEGCKEHTKPDIAQDDVWDLKLSMKTSPLQSFQSRWGLWSRSCVVITVTLPAYVDDQEYYDAVSTLTRIRV